MEKIEELEKRLNNLEKAFQQLLKVLKSANSKVESRLKGDPLGNIFNELNKELRRIS